MIFFQINWWRLHWLRLVHWLDGALPLQCPQCGRWSRKRSMRWAYHHVAGAVVICANCYQDLYGDEGGD